DLHAGDEVAVPDRLEERVGEAEIEQVLHRLLAEVVIDAEDAILRKLLLQYLIERLRRGEITPKRFLDDHTPALGGPGGAQVIDDHRKHAGRDGEVVERTLGVSERLAQRNERLPLAVVPIVVPQQIHEARHGRIIWR